MIHGGDIYGFEEEKMNTILDFSANISPLGMPESVKTSMIRAMSEAVHYPDPQSRRLKACLAKKHQLPLDHIICGNGAADVIYRLIYAVKPKRAVVIHPTFVEYEEAMAQVGTEIVGYDLNHEDFMIHEDICETITEDIDIIFICNPNNPTGVLTERSILLKVLKAAEKAHALLVVDECFLNFTGDEEVYSMIHQMQNSKNLLILKSFTKMYAIPGIRLGYALCSDVVLLNKMRHAGQTWPVSTIAEAAGMTAMLEEAYVEQVVEYVKVERRYIEQKLSEMSIRFIHGNANYILIHVPGIQNLYDRMLKKNIMIRTCGNYENLNSEWYRIAINTHEANDKMLSALKTVLEEEK